MITLVETLNYKCLRHTRRELRPLQVLVGPNASGKSAFLDVLAFFRDLLARGVEEAVLARSSSFYELVWGKQGESFDLAIELAIPGDLRIRADGYTHCRYEVRVAEDVFGGVWLSRETLWLRRALDTAKRPPQRTLFPTEPEPPQSIVQEPHRRTPLGWRKVVTRMPEGNVYFRSETSGWNAPFRIDARRAAFANLPEDEQRFPIALWARRVLSEGVQVLALNSQRMREPCRPDAPWEFQCDGSNLPLVVRRLQKQHDRFQRWLMHVRTVLPDIEHIDVKEREMDRHLYLLVQFAKGPSLPGWMLSDGTLRFLALTLLAYLPPGNKVYLIEEPENGIHPKALESVFQSVSSVYEGQILMATHSPLLLALARPQDILCFARTESGATDIVRGDEHPRLKDWRGETDLGVLFAAGVLG